MTGEDHQRAALSRRAGAVLVGLFAVWQLVYLPGANLIDFVPRRVGPPMEPITDGYQARGTFTSCEPLQRAADVTGDVLDFWTEVSGQEQGWALFAPGMPPYSMFPAAELRFADGTTETLLSPYEPTDKQNPRLRAPLLDNHPFNFEAQLTYPVWFVPPQEVAAAFAAPEDVAKLPEVYRTLPETARVWRGVVRAWLAWRVNGYRAAHPERGAPVEVVLKHRYLLTPSPTEPRGWTRPITERPYARWRPADDRYEAYDVVNGRFVPVGAGEVAP
jgi:hypothetical protein